MMGMAGKGGEILGLQRKNEDFWAIKESKFEQSLNGRNRYFGKKVTRNGTK